MNRGYVIRQIESDDIGKVLLVEEKAWPQLIRANEMQFRSRLEIFPPGFFGAYYNDQLVGVTTSMIIGAHIHPLNWSAITANGYCTNHDKQESNLYIVSVGVMPDFQCRKIGSALIQAQVGLAQKLGLRNVLVGARCPMFHIYESTMPVHEYVYLKKGHEKLDPEIRFYERNGFSIEKVVPHYMEGDVESCEYGVLMFMQLNTSSNQ